MELNFSRNGLCVWSFGSVYCCNAVVERTLHRQLLIGSTLVSLLKKYMNLLVLLTVQMDQIFWICNNAFFKENSFCMVFHKSMRKINVLKVVAANFGKLVLFVVENIYCKAVELHVWKNKTKKQTNKQKHKQTNKTNSLKKHHISSRICEFFTRHDVSIMKLLPTGTLLLLQNP